MLQFNFSHRFEGVVWNMLVYPQQDVLLLEIRNADQKVVSFSALNYAENLFLWNNRKLDEAWWISLSAVEAGVVLFTVYLDKNNPDKKALMAYSLSNLELKWWNNDFAVGAVEGNQVMGFTSRLGLQEKALDLHSGKEIARASGSVKHVAKELILKPVQYLEGTAYFDTVKVFLADRLNFSALSSLEYLETDSCIIVSGYTEENGLVNYLLVLSRKGDLLFKEKINGPVKGIGFETFFVLGGCLFFVQNKVELVSYKLI